MVHDEVKLKTVNLVFAASPLNMKHKGVIEWSPGNQDNKSYKPKVTPSVMNVAS